MGLYCLSMLLKQASNYVGNDRSGTKRLLSVRVVVKDSALARIIGISTNKALKAEDR